MLLQLKNCQSRVVGTKQTLKELEQDRVKTVFIAQDADESLREQILSLAKTMEAEIVYVPTMEELGLACKIDVGAATAAILGD